VQNREVLVWCHTNAARLPRGLIPKGHLCCVRILNHVKIGNDISAVIPNETGACSFGYLIKIEGEKIALNRDRRDVHNRRRRLAKEGNGRFFSRRKLAAGSDRTRGRTGIVERCTINPCLFHEHENGPKKHRSGPSIHPGEWARAAASVELSH